MMWIKTYLQMVLFIQKIVVLDLICLLECLMFPLVILEPQFLFRNLIFIKLILITKGYKSLKDAKFYFIASEDFEIGSYPRKIEKFKVIFDLPTYYPERPIRPKFGRFWL